MSAKKAKLIRKQLKKSGKFDIKVKADYRIAKKVSKVIYIDGELGGKKAITVKRNIIVNAAKIQYRQLKKLLKKEIKNGNDK